VSRPAAEGTVRYRLNSYHDRNTTVVGERDWPLFATGEGVDLLGADGQHRRLIAARRGPTVGTGLRLSGR
jgi:hypothetical protein